METPGDSNPMETDSAERIVGFIAHQDGVSSATVATLEGTALASSGTPEAGREAALGAFICERAEELSGDGDLRGMGKVVSESAFRELAIHGGENEGLVIRLEGACLVLATRPGQLAAAERSVTPVVTRFGRPAASQERG